MGLYRCLSLNNGEKNERLTLFAPHGAFFALPNMCQLAVEHPAAVAQPAALATCLLLVTGGAPILFTFYAGYRSGWWTLFGQLAA